MKFAHVRGSKIQAITWQHGSPLPPGCVELPIVIEPKPSISHTEELDSFYEVAAGRTHVVCRYIVQDRAPERAIPDGSTVIIQQVPAAVDTSSIDAQVAALQAKLAEMQAAQDAQTAAQSVGALMAAIQHGTPAEAEAAASELQRVAAAAGMTVEQLAASWAAKRDQAIATLKGAA